MPPTDDTLDPSAPLADTLDVTQVDASLTGSDASITVTREQPGRYVAPGPDPTINELGRGGIGRVLVVRDAHLSREVALKELLTRAAPGSAGSGRDALVFTRFLREARITGQLEHPNIVPVYELGQRPDGTLYYTMKVVRGRTLAEALTQCDGLSDRLALLKHFADLCNAMAYAHARGIIHRDLKPGNVMLGEFGETVLLDWGLARPVDGANDDLDRVAISGGPAAHLDDPAATAEGSILGTPLYMSPEQARGEPDLGPQTDVWSLGVMLYELLTGERPFTGNNAIAVLTAVTTGTPDPVRSRAPDAPPELAAVAERAINRDRSLRYADAGELAAEVSAFLIGDRVRAYRYGLREVLARFARRHMISLSVAAVGAVMLLGLGAWAHLGVRAQRDRAMSAEDEATRAAATARAAEAAAEAARDEAEGLVQYMVGDLRQTLEPLGRLDLLDRVVARVAAHVEADAAAVTRDPAAEPARSRSRAGTQFLVARLASARGMAEDARMAANEAWRLRARLVEADARSQHQLDLARSELQLAGLDRQDGLRDAAEQRVKAALARLEPLGDDPEARFSRADGLVDLGDLRATGGDLDGAEALYRDAMTLREGLMSSQPDETRWQQAAAETHDQLGDVRFNRGDLDGALASYTAGLKLREALVASRPNNLRWVRELGISHDQLGDVYFEQGEPQKALAAWDEAMSRLTRAYNANPTHLGWRRDAAIGRLKMADGLAGLGKTEAAAGALSSVIEDLTALSEQSRRDTGWARDLNVARWRRADLLVQLDRVAEAAPLLDDALRDAEALVSRVPGNVLYRHDLAVAHLKQADLRVRRGDPVAAALAYRTAGRLLGALAQAETHSAAVARDRAIARRRLAAVLARPDLDRAALWTAVRAADAQRGLGGVADTAGYGAGAGALAMQRLRPKGSVTADAEDEAPEAVVEELDEGGAGRGDMRAPPARRARSRGRASGGMPERAKAAAGAPVLLGDEYGLEQKAEQEPEKVAADPAPTGGAPADRAADRAPAAAAMAPAEPAMAEAAPGAPPPPPPPPPAAAAAPSAARDPLDLLDDPLLGEADAEWAEADVRPWVGAGDRTAPRARPGERGASIEADEAAAPDPRGARPRIAPARKGMSAPRARPPTPQE